jgi:hypothetical protein
MLVGVGLDQREDMHGFNRVPSLRDVAHGGDLCTFNNRSAPGNPSGQAARAVHHVQNHTLLGKSPPASQAGRRDGPAL